MFNLKKDNFIKGYVQLDNIKKLIMYQWSYEIPLFVV